MPERGSTTTSLYQGPDSYSVQRDMWDVQQRTMPQADQLALTTFDTYWGGGVTSHALAAGDTWYLAPLKPLTRDFAVAEARIRVTTLAAGEHADVAVFVQMPEPTPTLLVVPQLYLEFDVGATGVRTSPVLEGPNSELPILRPERQYWLGFNADTTTSKYATLVGLYTVTPLREFPYQHESSHQIPLAQTTESANAYFPYIALLSKRAAEMF